MATRRRTQSNPFASANLGSGARTTVGGSYENPRLGIQDYSAFGRGLASTFRMPEQQEVEKKQDLNLNLGNFESDKDNFFVDTSGVMQDMSSDISTLVNNAWKNGELTQLNNSYQNALAGSQEERNILAHINGYNQAIGPKDSNFVKYFAALDDGVHDHNVSNRQLPGLDGGNLNGTIADFIRIGNENPNAIKIASKRNSNGIMQYGFEVSGLGFVNASAMTNKWISKNMNVKYNQAGALSDDYKQFQVGNFKPIFYDSGTNVFEGTNQEFKVKRENEIVQDGSINTFNNIAINAANTRFSSQNDAYFASAFDQMKKAYNSNKFEFNKDLQEELNESEGNISDDLRLRLLKDYYQENFKLTNGSSMYVRGEDGRAIAKTAANLKEFMPDYMKTGQKTGEGGFSFGFGTGSGGSADYYVAGLQQLYGTINPDTEQRQGGIVDNRGNVPLEKVADFAQQWGVNTHGAGTKVFSVAGVEKYYKDLYNYEEAKQSSRDNNNPGKDQIDAMINDIFKQEPSYFYYVPSGGKDPIPAENLGKPPKNISEGISKGDYLQFGPLSVPVSNFMREYRNSLDSSEKKLFEGAASRMGINIYGVQQEN